MFFSLKGEGDMEGDKKGEGTKRKGGGRGELTTGMKGRWGWVEGTKYYFRPLELR
jgi:hypothetical protein